MKIGDYLRQCRKDKNLTLKQLSNLSNVSYSQIAKIERGETVPSKETILKLCMVLDLNPEYMLTLGGYSDPKDAKLNNLLTSIINFKSDSDDLNNRTDNTTYTQVLPILTIDKYPGKEIEYVDLIAAEASNFFYVKETVNKKGLALKADAIVGFRIEMNNINPKTVVGYGTAIRFKD